MTTLRRLSSRRLATLAAALGAIASTTPAALAQGTYLASEDLLVVQYESVADTSGDWNISTSTPGFTGDSYVIWDGPNLFNQPGAQGVFQFDFEIPTGGTWILNLRNRHENPDATEENDVWIRMDDERWIKVFSNRPGSVGAWTWESRFDEGSQPEASYNLAPGRHTLHFSGRSFGFKIDQLHLFRPGAPGARDISQPESPQRFGTSYCSANANSSGTFSSISAIGSPRATDNDLTLVVEGLPANQFGIFLASDQEGFVPNLSGTAGNLCITSPGRFGRIESSGSNGTVSTTVDLTNIPRPSGPVAAMAGQTFRFQFWHRDGATANLSTGIRVPFN